MLKVKLFGVEFENPVWTASGTFGFGLEYAPYLDLNRVGAVCVKGLSVKPREGNEPPRIWETPCGMLNAIGLQNPGVEYFVEEIVPKLKEYRCRVIANIYGSTVEEYRAVAAALKGVDGVDAVELNVSCPNVKKGGLAFGVDPVEAARVTEAVKSVCDKPVIVKLSPNVTDPVEIAKAVESAGADAISAINTLLGMAIDIRKRKPRLKNRFGGLSGPAIKPVAVRIVYQVSKAVSVPVIGIGGITTWEDAVEFFLAGASAVQVGTANFFNPKAVEEIVAGIENYMREEGFKSVGEMVGALRE
ncbi:dihydroorotate dehydrogenase family protein [Thermovibrio ammonificans HB-1]|uniref:Dihydroorotate dehydrogenase n=1 Tax=Thermovibrio ammonificans (strain DSM 15698 / JCM 12110 / HB-1) TaxID=648996 RepID=E8T3K1_THEA1|nr:dihydroorotate dehydrogenase [Thermovibrio ammonificans]ADU96132.1 dihydroorotate dehydrogenase family protein [Thermovibrio ammonificans HB-1]